MGNICCWKSQDIPLLSGSAYEEFIFNDPPTPRNTGHMAPSTVCMPSPPPQRVVAGRPPLWQPSQDHIKHPPLQSDQLSPSSNLGSV